MEPRANQLDLASSYDCSTLPPPASPAPAAAASRERGVALVLVLAFLALLSVLLVAFFSSVRTDLQSASSYAGAVTVAQLAENASNIVIGQITDATQIAGRSGKPQSKQLTWASQPGLIHTYGSDGHPGSSYKLYSSADMVTPAEHDYLPAAGRKSDYGSAE